MLHESVSEGVASGAGVFAASSLLLRQLAIPPARKLMVASALGATILTSHMTLTSAHDRLE